MEKIIFRQDKKDGSYLAIYCEWYDTYRGVVDVRQIDLWHDYSGDTQATVWCCSEASFEYLYNDTRIIHKSDPVIPVLLDALTRCDGCEYEVRERIQWSRRGEAIA